MSKELYSIKELSRLGYSEASLRKACHAKGQSFAIRTSGGGKFLINREAYDKWALKMN